MLFAAGAAAQAPPHLKRLPGGVLERGPAPAALAGAREGGQVPLWLPGGERQFEVERVVAAGAATTRFGRLRGVGEAAITLGPDGGFGRVAQGGTVWLLEYRGGEAFAVRAGEGGLAFADYDRGALTAAAAKASGPTPAAKQAGLPNRTVDVLGLYDADFAARYPGALAETRIAHFVALANQALVDSDVSVTLRIVLTQLAAGTVSPNAIANIGEMYFAQQPGGSFAGADLLTLRDITGADLVSFFRVHDLYARGVCGVAFFPDDFRAGVNVVMDGESGGSVCDDHTFAHEVGHNLGARHQLAADATVARGHAFARPGQFTTIMGSFGTGKPDRQRQLAYYSNPRIACGNLPCGSANEDNAGAMDDNAQQVAEYAPTRDFGRLAVRPQPTLADSDGDGVIDRTDAFPFDATRSVDTDGDGVADADDAFPSNSTEWADSDGGGFGDNADTDDDNDGVPDVSDAFPLDPAESADADGDGWGDNSDQYDADPFEQRDTDLGGLGDRADGNDDNDGIADFAPFNAAADGELLVADGATDRILRFRGSDYASLGTLLQLGANEVTFRSGMAGAPSGEVYFVAASQLRVLDRLRSTTAELMLDPASHPLVGTGFPLSPVVLPTGDVVVGEMGGSGRLIAMRPAASHAATPLIRSYSIGLPECGPHLAPGIAGDVLMLDGAGGALLRYSYGGDPLTSDPATTASFVPAAPMLAAGGIAQAAGGLLFWVDRRDGAVRSLDVNTGADGGFTIAGADAAAITVSPDGQLFVAQRAGGVRAYDGGSGADLGLVVPAASTAQPLALAWVPTIVDTSLPPYLPPTPPAPSADAATTPAVGGTPPLPPPCTTACIATSGGGGGPFDPRLALVLALLGWRRLRRALALSAGLLLLAACGGGSPAPQAAAPVAAAELKAPAGTYKIDPHHASLAFRLKHLGLADYVARFMKFEATVVLDPANLANSTVTVAIDPASVRTDYVGDFKATHKDSPYGSFEERIAREEKFLNSDKFPAITFKSTRVEPAGPGRLRITGDLTFLGQTHPVTLDAMLTGSYDKHPFFGYGAFGMTATTTFTRSEWGMTGTQQFLGDAVTVEFYGEFGQQVEAPPAS
ncbi:MAG: YceI family protein [Gammaproteobacteria bacterium]